MFRRPIVLIVIAALVGCSPLAGRQDGRKSSRLDTRTASKVDAKKAGSKKSKAGEAKPYTPLPEIVLIQPEWLDQSCEIQLRDDDPDKSQFYRGKLISADDKVIVVEKPEVHTLNHKKHPIFGTLFVNSAHGRQQSDEDVTIPREQIASIQPMLLTP